MKNLTLITTMIFSTTLFNHVHAGDVTLPHTFTKGQAAHADEVNANFNAVANAINDNATQITNLNNTSATLDNRITTLESGGGLPRVIFGNSNTTLRAMPNGGTFAQVDELQVPAGNWKTTFEFELRKGGSNLNGECRLTGTNGVRGAYQHINCCDLATTDNASLSTVVTGPATVRLECRKIQDLLLYVVSSSVHAIEVGTILNAGANGSSTRNTPQ